MKQTPSIIPSFKNIVEIILVSATHFRNHPTRIPTRKLDCRFLGKIRFSIYLSSCFLSFFSMENILTLAANLDKVSVCERKILWFSSFFISVLFSTVWVTFNPSWRPDITLVFYIFALESNI